MQRTTMLSPAAALLLALGAGAAAPFGVPVAAAQQADAQTPEQQLADFIHFVLIGNFEVARDLAEQLAASAGSDEEFARMVEGSGEAQRFDNAVSRALRVEGLSVSAGKLAERFRSGKLAMARNPDEVARNIELLTSGVVGRARGRDRLLAAGEYAMPQLLAALLQQDNVRLRAEVRLLLIDMGRQAIAPLMTALPALDPADQQAVVDILGSAQYRTGLPALAEVHRTATAPTLRTAAERAIRSLGGEVGADPAELYAQLGELYFEQRSELTSFEGEDHQLLWTYDQALGLVMTAIRTEVFHEAMAMRTAERALSINPAQPGAVGLWVAANFSREADTPDGYDNPAYGADRREAMYYAVAAGPAIGQSVLARAVDAGSTVLARRAIEAVRTTAGRDLLVTPGEDGRSPLLDALAYPDRRVQYDAALAIAAAQPRSGFAGAERVVPTLASMIREAGVRYAVVLAGPDREEYDRLRAIVEAEGFRVLPPAERGLSDIEGVLADTPGVELVVVSAAAERAQRLIDEARAALKLSVAPIVVLSAPEDLAALNLQYGRDRAVAVRRRSIDRDQLNATIDALVRSVAGTAIGDDEALGYASAALDALRDLALSGSAALPIEDATAALLQALAEAPADLRLRVGEVLAFVDEPDAQVALFDAAIAAEGAPRVRFLEQVTASAKRFGNMLQPRQVAAALDLVRTARDDAEATAAAGLAGALGLSGADIVPLILSDAGDSRTSRVLGGR